MFPAAAAANRSIFYAGGKEKSVASVLASLTSKHGGTTVGDTMMAAAETAEPTTVAASTAAAPTQAPNVTRLSHMVEQATILAPVMVQLLASLDPMPGLAASVLDDEPQLRRTAGGLI